MKRIYEFAVLGFISTILIFGLTENAAAQSPAPDKVAEEFYRWYLNTPNKQAAAVEEKLSKRRAEILIGSNRQEAPLDPQIRMRQYVSKKLLAWIASAKHEDYGADYFLDAQNRDDGWQPAAAKPVIEGDCAVVKITLAAPANVESEPNSRVLTLRMIKEDGAWKIDCVNNRKPT